MISTFLTLVYVPILYSLFDELKEKIKVIIPAKFHSVKKGEING